MRISDWSSDVCSSDLLITFIAYVPGFMNAFLISTILLDRRPVRRVPMHYPPVTVLVACYNEGGNIEHTIDSLAQQGYPGAMTVLVLDDGSTRSEEHTSELQSLMRISYAVFCLKKKTSSIE